MNLVQQSLSDIVSRGPHTFSSPMPQPAFDVWWEKEFGNKMRGSKYVARRAWNAALREMGVFDDKVSP